VSEYPVAWHRPTDSKSIVIPSVFLCMMLKLRINHEFNKAWNAMKLMNCVWIRGHVASTELFKSIDVPAVVLTCWNHDFKNVNMSKDMTKMLPDTEGGGPRLWNSQAPILFISALEPLLLKQMLWKNNNFKRRWALFSWKLTGDPLGHPGPSGRSDQPATS